MVNRKQDLSRKEKIKFLQAIKEGRLNPESLGESIEFFIVHGLEPDGKYLISEQRPNPRPNKYLTPEEFEEWFKQMDEINRNRKQPHKFNILRWVEQLTN